MSSCHQPIPAFLDSLSSEVKLQGAGDQRMKFYCNYTPDVTSISSCECNKVVTDTIQDLVQVWSQNNFYSHERNKPPKYNNKQKKCEQNTASPAKWPKCRYDFVAFTWRFVLLFQVMKLYYN